jgi:peroxiredoxin (alkyl hydroperoxide reductase subunit C)
MPAEVGQPAPDFTLRDVDNNPVSLADLKGKKTVLMFVPFPWTGICDNESCDLRDDQGFENEGAQTVIISTYPRPALKHWSDENNLGNLKVLSDFWPHGATSQAYGAFNETVGSNWRASYVLDENGVVRDIIRTDSLGERREHAKYKQALSSF